MIHVRNLVKSRGDSKNASSGLASASVSLSSGQRILVLDPKDGPMSLPHKHTVRQELP